jgi:hypothetical protein
MTYVGIKPPGVLVKNVYHQNQGMDAGVVFRPISFKTLPELNEHHPYGPYCNLKDGCNPIFAKVTGIVSRVRAKSGSAVISTTGTHSFLLPDFTISLDVQPITFAKMGLQPSLSCNMDRMGIVSLALEGF